MVQSLLVGYLSTGYMKLEKFKRRLVIHEILRQHASV
ncbi:Uncharacterised protein [Mycobacteroides abscessus]|nr:Uncharacterised protein [Mycobacteroides abscessus]